VISRHRARSRVRRRNDRSHAAPKTRSLHLRHAVCDERSCIDCPKEIFGLLDPRQVDRHGVRRLSGQDASNSERDCK
jgi:hypothetical protein